MSGFNRLIAVVAACMLLGPLIPVQAQTRKGDVFMAEGRLHEAKKEWDAALESYRKAAAEDPTDPVYQLAVDKCRIQAGQAHVEKGLNLRSQGWLADSLIEFQKANAIDPGSAIALQELKQVLALTLGQTSGKDETDKTSRLLDVPELRPSTPGVIDLKMTGKSKTIFETVARYAGMNLLWDPDYAAPQHDIFTVNFKDATLDQALDSVAAMTKSTWRRLSPTIIYVK